MEKRNKYFIDCIKCKRYSIRGNKALSLCRKCYRVLPKNKAKENAYSKRWYKLHRNSEIEKNREYRKLNRELFNWYHDKDRFDGLKKIILEKDNYKCQSCGTNENLAIHHIDGTNYRKGNANNELDNLIVLCVSCHSFLHKHQNRIKRILLREDIVQTLVKTKEVYWKQHPPRKRS